MWTCCWCVCWSGSVWLGYLNQRVASCQESTTWPGFQSLRLRQAAGKIAAMTPTATWPWKPSCWAAGSNVCWSTVWIRQNTCMCATRVQRSTCTARISTTVELQNCTTPASVKIHVLLSFTCCDVMLQWLESTVRKPLVNQAIKVFDRNLQSNLSAELHWYANEGYWQQCVLKQWEVLLEESGLWHEASPHSVVAVTCMFSMSHIHLVQTFCRYLQLKLFSSSIKIFLHIQYSSCIVPSPFPPPIRFFVPLPSRIPSAGMGCAVLSVQSDVPTIPYLSTLVFFNYINTKERLNVWKHLFMLDPLKDDSSIWSHLTLISFLPGSRWFQFISLKNNTQGHLHKICVFIGSNCHMNSYVITLNCRFRSSFNTNMFPGLQ